MLNESSTGYAIRAATFGPCMIQAEVQFDSNESQCAIAARLWLLYSLR
jgi:hypothetical protein